MFQVIATVMALLREATPTLAQTPSGTLSATAPGFAPAAPPNSTNGQPIDPTKNVLDLVLAETKRIDQLAAQKPIADLELARVNKASVDSSALLLATAVKELKTDSSDRTAKLEQFANEQRGRASGGNEVWALIGVIITILLVAIGLLLNTMKKSNFPPEIVETIITEIKRRGIS